MAKKFNLLSKDYKTLERTLTADVVAGAYVADEDMVGFYLVDGVNGAKATVIVEAEQVAVEKASGQAWSPGDTIYYHVANGNCTNVDTGAIQVGYVHESALTADVEGIISFDGYARFLKA